MARRVYSEPTLSFKPLENRWIASFKAQHAPRGLHPPTSPAFQLGFLFKRGFSLPLLAWKAAPPGWEPSTALSRCRLCLLPLESPRVSFGICISWLCFPRTPKKPPGEQALEAGRCGMAGG